MALTNNDLEQAYQYFMQKGQSLAGLPDGGDDLTCMFLAPVLKYNQGGTSAELVRVSIALLQGADAFETWKKKTGNEGATFDDFLKEFKGEQGLPFLYEDFTEEQLTALALTWEKLTEEQKEGLKLKFESLTPGNIEILQEPAREAATEARRDMNTIKSEWVAEKEDIEANKKEWDDLNEQAIESLETAKQEATQAATSANDIANHPTYIGEDNYVYKWDKSKQVYIKTDINVRGDIGESGVFLGDPSAAPSWAKVVINPNGEDFIDPDVLSQIAWGQEIMEGQSSTDWTSGMVGNRSLFREYESKCGRYLLKNDGSMAKISPYNGNVFVDGTPVDETKGHVMYYEPRLFFLVKTDIATGKTYLWQSMQNIGGKELPPLCIGAYMGWRNGSALTSRSGVVPARSRTISNFWTDAQVNGAQFGLGDYNYRKRLIMHGLAKYGNTNIQAMLGNGVGGSVNKNLWATASTFLTGATKDMGDQSGKIDIEVVNGEFVGVDCSRVNFCGIEDPYGWYWELIQNVYFGSSNNAGQIGNEIFIYEGNRMPTANELLTHPDGDFRQLVRLPTGGWMKTILLGEHFDIFTKTLGGGSTSYWADYHTSSSVGQLLLFGGSASYGASCGFGYAYSNRAFSYTSSSFGARLAYYGDIRFVDGKDI